MIREQILAFTKSHPDMRPKHVVEAFEAVWFENGLSDVAVSDASAYADKVLSERKVVP